MQTPPSSVLIKLRSKKKRGCKFAFPYILTLVQHIRVSWFCLICVDEGMFAAGNDYGVCCPSGPLPLRLSKPGECPAPPSSPEENVAVCASTSSCRADLECPGDDKCCLGCCTRPTSVSGESRPACIPHTRASTGFQAISKKSIQWNARLQAPHEY